MAMAVSALARGRTRPQAGPTPSPVLTHDLVMAVSVLAGAVPEQERLEGEPRVGSEPCHVHTSKPIPFSDNTIKQANQSRIWLPKR